MALQPLFVDEGKAAKLLDMRRTEFRELVERGALPRPVRFDRWDVDELQRAMRGDGARTNEALDL